MLSSSIDGLTQSKGQLFTVFEQMKRCRGDQTRSKQMCMINTIFFISHFQSKLNIYKSLINKLFHPDLSETFLVFRSAFIPLRINNIVMELNPFHPNYLKQIKFLTKRRSSQKDVAAKSLLKQPPSQQKRAPLIKTQTKIQQSQQILTASFPLQHQFFTSNLAYTKQGCLFVYLKKLNNISGRSYIFFPEGIVACCNIINKKLTGWAVIFIRNQFYTVTHFEGGKFHGLHYSYDVRCGLIIQSQYKCGKLHSIRKGTADSQKSFQRCLKNQQIIDIFNRSINFVYLDDYLPKIQSRSGNYYGEKKGEMPSGVGIMLTQKQYFFGNFKRGVIDGQGTMVFSDGNSYTGQFQSGVMKGLGCYYEHGSIFYQDSQKALRKEDFYQRRNLSNYFNIQILLDTFHQLFKYYQTISTIYLERKKKQSEIDPESFVDIEVQNQDEILEGDQNDQADSHKSEKNQVFYLDQILKDIGPTQKKSIHSKGPNKTLKNTKQNTKEEQQENHNLIKQKLTKGSKGNRMLKDDEWQQIIEDLQEQNVNNEDDFMKPKKNNSIEEEQSNIKKNNHQTSIDPRNMTYFRPERQGQMQKQQNKILGKIQQKK